MRAGCVTLRVFATATHGSPHCTATILMSSESRLSAGTKRTLEPLMTALHPHSECSAAQAALAAGGWRRRHIASGCGTTMGTKRCMAVHGGQHQFFLTLVQPCDLAHRTCALSSPTSSGHVRSVSWHLRHSTATNAPNMSGPVGSRLYSTARRTCCTALLDEAGPKA